MQNRYAGDVGDFIKLGLIRHLAAARLSFGINWYLTPDEVHNADGKHVAYVEPGNRQHVSLKACDPDLMERLSRVVAGSRSVKALEDSGALPANALTFGEVLDRSTDRQAWHERALAELVSADTVFVDPSDATEAGRLLSVPASWVLAEARANRIPHVRLGRYVRFSADDLEEWWRARMQGPWRARGAASRTARSLLVDRQAE